MLDLFGGVKSPISHQLATEKYLALQEDKHLPGCGQ